MDYSQLVKFVGDRFGSCYANTSFYNNIATWLSWYKGYLKTFHHVKVSNGISMPERDIYQLGMAKRVCEDWASSMLSEEVQIVINTSAGNKSNKFVQGKLNNGGVLGSNNFSDVLARALEQMFALGTVAIVEELTGNIEVQEGNIRSAKECRIRVKDYNATRIVPVSWSNGVVYEASFVSEFTYQGKTYYIVSTHKLESDGYVIYNDVVDAGFRNAILKVNPVPVIRTKSRRPYFQIMRTNIVNNVDLDSPMGISIYANAIDNLKGCDIAYDSCLREVITGQRIIMMNKCLLTKADDGTPIPPQDAKQNYMMFFGDEARADLAEFIKEFHPTMNTDALDKELQTQLDLLSSKVGLGTDYYRVSSYNHKVTATEYVGERNDFMRNSKKIARTVQTALKDMTLSILDIGKNILGNNVDDKATVDILMSDGVVEDDAKEREQDRQDVKDGLMSKAEYREKWYGETPEQAKAAVAAIQAENTSTGEQKQQDSE